VVSRLPNGSGGRAVKPIVETPEGTREIEYTKLSSEEIEQRLRIYEQQYGSYEKFLGQYDCGASSFDEDLEKLSP
jgi:hypothetical protein